MFTKKSRILFACLSVSAILAGCSSSSDNKKEDSHDDTHIESAGRLAFYNKQSDSGAIKVFDLDSKSLQATIALTGGDARLYASPNSRYAVVTQRNDGLVSFVDGGLYSEDHGDHMHDYKKDPTKLEFSLSGTKPTHYTAHESHAAVFFDGQEGVVSSVSLLSDAAIGAGKEVDSLSLTNNMHGVAKLIEDKLFVTYKDPSITDTTLPAAVERYGFDNGAISNESEHRYTEACPKLHGSAATDAYITFGCSDGVLAIDLSKTDYPATKLNNPETILKGKRIGKLYSNHSVNEFVGVAGNQFYVVDVKNASKPYKELSLPEGFARASAGFNHEGSVFFILGKSGKLHLFKTADWTSLPSVTVTDAIKEDESSPIVTLSKSEDKLFVLKPNGKAVVVVNSDTGEVLETVELGFTASRMVWLGITKHEEHDH